MMYGFLQKKSKIDTDQISELAIIYKNIFPVFDSTNSKGMKKCELK